MAVQLTIEYEKLVELVDQLSVDQQQNLIQHLAQQANILTAQEKVELLNSTIHDLGEIPADFSFSREDWYGDDGR
jgi:hypothetical protein